MKMIETNTKMMKEAHRMAKEIKAEFPNVDYKLQVSLCVSYLMEEETKKIIAANEAKEAKKEVAAEVIELKNYLKTENKEAKKEDVKAATNNDIKMNKTIKTENNEVNAIDEFFKSWKERTIKYLEPQYTEKSAEAFERKIASLDKSIEKKYGTLIKNIKKLIGGITNLEYIKLDEQFNCKGLVYGEKGRCYICLVGAADNNGKPKNDLKVRERKNQ